MLFGVAIADDRLLNESRRIFVNLNRGPGGGKQGNTTYLAQFQSNLNVRFQKAVFDRACIGAEACNQLFQAIADFQKTQIKLFARRGLDGSVFDNSVAPSMRLDYAPPGRLTARINS